MKRERNLLLNDAWPCGMQGLRQILSVQTCLARGRKGHLVGYPDQLTSSSEAKQQQLHCTICHQAPAQRLDPAAAGNAWHTSKPAGIFACCWWCAVWIFVSLVVCWASTLLLWSVQRVEGREGNLHFQPSFRPGYVLKHVNCMERQTLEVGRGGGEKTKVHTRGKAISVTARSL